MLGLIYAYDGETEKEHAAYRRAAELNPSNARAVMGLANIATSRGKLDGALRWAKRARALDPTFGSYSFRVAWIYQQLGDPDQAERSYRRWLQIDPGSLHARGQLARLYVLQGEPNRARAQLDTLLAEHADSEGAWHWAGQVLTYLGDLHKAKHYLDKTAQNRSPEFPAPPVRLGYVNWKLGDRHRAEAMLREAEAEQRRMVEEKGWKDNSIELARIYTIRGEREEALRWLKRAIDSGLREHRILTRDPLLENLRGDPRFERMMADLKAQNESMRVRAEREGW